MILCDRPCSNKSEYGYCNTTYCINPVIPNTAVGTFPPPQLIKTNADRIRCMTDDELAEWFCTMCNFGDFCPYKDDCDSNGSGVLKWLKEEVKDGN